MLSAFGGSERKWPILQPDQPPDHIAKDAPHPAAIAESNRRDARSDPRQLSRNPESPPRDKRLRPLENPTQPTVISYRHPFINPHDSDPFSPLIWVAEGCADRLQLERVTLYACDNGEDAAKPSAAAGG